MHLLHLLSTCFPTSLSTAAIRASAIALLSGILKDFYAWEPDKRLSGKQEALGG